VHGGQDFSAPQRIDARTLKALKDLIPLAPLHQPHNLKPVELVAQSHPQLPQVACFDTAFHRTQPRLNQLYALPRKMTDEGIVRYGFHGLSYEYIASQLPRVAGDKADGRVIVAHLGNGSSLCAMKGRRSVATTMGFTPLDGLMMGTRAGATDPGIVLHLMQEKGMSAAQVADIFNKQSGLKGVSGTTADMRALLAAGTKEAAEAIDLFALYAARHIAALTADIGGLDALVFTAGIGENAQPVRDRICARLAHLGVGGTVPVHVIRTDEELMIARHVKAGLAPRPAPGAQPS
jgi:acetate kinase